MSWKFNLGLPLLGRTKLRNPEFDRQRIAKTWFIIGSPKKSRKYWQASIKTGNTVGKMLNHMNSSIKVITLNLMRCASHLTKTSSSIFFLNFNPSNVYNVKLFCIYCCCFACVSDVLNLPSIKNDLSFGYDFNEILVWQWNKSPQFVCLSLNEFPSSTS